MSGGYAQFLEYSQMRSFNLAGVNLSGTTNLVIQSSTADAKGAWLSLGTLVTDCMALIVTISYLNAGGTDNGVSTDIGIGSSGSQLVLIADINQSQPPGGAAVLVTFQHIIPVSLTAGTQIWARSAVNVASSTCFIGAGFTSIDKSFSANREFSGIDTIGKTATGFGIQMVGGNAVRGSYVQIGTALNDYSGFFLCFDLATTTGESLYLMDIAQGASGSQFLILPNLVIAADYGMSGMDLEYTPIPIPKGTVLWARSCNVDSSTKSAGVTFYGVY